MKAHFVSQWLLVITILSFCVTADTQTSEQLAAGIMGKDGWLFYRHELTEDGHAAMTDASLHLIQRFNRVLAANGIGMLVVMVPLKMRVYAEYLPDDIKMGDYMIGNYERMGKVLQAARVNVANLNSVFLDRAKRNSDTSLFFRLDTHWTPGGAMLAAQTIQEAISSKPELKKAFEATPEVPMKIVYSEHKQFSPSNDLVKQLPKDAPTFAREQVLPFEASRTQLAKLELIGDALSTGVALVGSSYSRDWTGFSDALRYRLQRDVVTSAVGADRGFWVGMEGYLRDDAFQSQRPKVVIWEMPERDMRAPPDYPYREPRYVSDNTEWLLRVSALVQTSCRPSKVRASAAPLGLAADARTAALGTAATTDSDFIEILFDRPVDRLDYLSGRAKVLGSKVLTLEASGPGVVTRRFTMSVPGDEVAHVIKTPLPSNESGYTKVRVYPGMSNGFSLQELQVCRQPEDLLN